MRLWKKATDFACLQSRPPMQVTMQEAGYRLQLSFEEGGSCRSYSCCSHKLSIRVTHTRNTGPKWNTSRANEHPLEEGLEARFPSPSCNSPAPQPLATSARASSRLSSPGRPVKLDFFSRTASSTQMMSSSTLKMSYWLCYSRGRHQHSRKSLFLQLPPG